MVFRGFVMRFKQASSSGSRADRRPDALGLAHLRQGSRPLDWRRRVSDSIAYALLVYTALQIFATIGALRGNSASMLPYLALVVLIAAIVPACRRFERRWNRLSDAEAADPAFAPAYRRDMIGLWLLAIGLPFALCGLLHLLHRLVVG